MYDAGGPQGRLDCVLPMGILVIIIMHLSMFAPLPPRTGVGNYRRELKFLKIYGLIPYLCVSKIP